MATTENTGLLTYIDEAGNKYLLYPVTRAEAVDGLEELLAQKAPASHVTDKNNPHGVTAEQVGARPSNWVPTATEVGARPSNWVPTATEVGARPSNWVPTAAEVGARPNTWTPTASEVGAAPDGYGLGKIWQKDVSGQDLNTVKESGWYYWGSATNAPLDWGTMFVNGANGSAVTQICFPASYPKGCMLVRYSTDDTWSTWEWVNPPMIVGDEYQTIERFKDKPVYAKAVSMSLAGSGNKYAYVSNMSDVVSFTAYEQNGIYANDIAFDSNITDIFVNVESGNFVINSSDMPAKTVTAIVKYIK